MEQTLSRQRYPAGAVLTEADRRLFTTLIRFDAVYCGHFKTNRQRITDYPAISNYQRELFQLPPRHYQPDAVVPLGPDQDITLPHDRGRFE